MHEPEELLSAAQKLFDECNYFQCLNVVRCALHKFPHHGRIWELKGRIHCKLGELESCISAMETASVYVPLSPIGCCVLAECYAVIEKPDLALLMINNLDERGEIGNEVRLEAAAIFDRLGFSLRALKQCRKAVCYDPDDAQAFYDLSRYLGRTGYPLHIVESMANKAIALAPKNVNYKIGLAALLIKADRFNRAYQLVKHLTSTDFKSIRCGCCLKKVIQLFDEFGDEQQVAEARAQYDRLTSNNHDHREEI